MGYPRRQGRTYGTPLTPPTELVGMHVKWRPKGGDGKRGAPAFGKVTTYDAEARTLTIEVRQTVSPWQPNPTRTVTIGLSHGPFTVI